jgi:probable rRNA maturation factor
MIDVNVSATVRKPIRRRLLVQAAVAALEPELDAADVSILVVGDRLMRSLNRDALGHDYVTDVLSFDHGDSPEGRVIEVVICAPYAARQANKLGIPPEQELARYVVHGCLHCAGYDDATPKAREQMWEQQEQILRKLFKAKYRQ